MTTTSVRTALVTGAASGLGQALVTRLKDDGWRVAGFDVQSPSEHVSHSVDVTDPAALTRAVDEVVAGFGGIDAVASCAGVFRNALTPVHALDDAAWATPLNVNLTGSFNVARATLTHLISRNGVIVFVASTAADHPQPGGVAYAASKAGVRALARSVSLEYARRGVRACSVSPGYMRTGMTEKVLSRDDIRAAIEKSIPAGRVADPAEVAGVIAFLFGADASFLTGQDITVDGGGALTAYTGTDDVARMWSRFEQRGGAPARG